MAEPTVVDARPDSEGIQPRPLGLGLLAVGTACTWVSFARLSWYRISGPNVITDVHGSSRSGGGPLLLVNPDLGSTHSIGIWVVVVGCVAAAALAQLASARMRTLLVAAAAVLASVALLNVVWRVGILELATGEGGLPPGTRIHVQFGVLIAIAGLALVGTSALCTPRERRARG